jgi:hypothetical protein
MCSCPPALLAYYRTHWTAQLLLRIRAAREHDGYVSIRGRRLGPGGRLAIHAGAVSRACSAEMRPYTPFWVSLVSVRVEAFA